MWPTSLVRWISHRLPRGPVPLVRGLVLAACGLGIGALCRIALIPIIAEGLPFITFIPPLLLVAVFGGLWPALLYLAAADAVGAWLWIRPYGTVDFTPAEIAAMGAFLVIGLAIIAIARIFVLMLDQLRRSEERATMLAQEMRHRVGNLLSLVQSIARQSGRHATDVPAFLAQFDTRLVAISRAQDLVTPGGNTPASVTALVTAAVEPFGLSHFRLAGGELSAPASLATGLCLILNELATNSVKYGALSVEGGYVVISWQQLGAGIAIVWKEHDGPPVAPPTRKGFGTVLAAAILPPERAACRIDFEPDGVRSVITIGETARLEAA